MKIYTTNTHAPTNGYDVSAAKERSSFHGLLKGTSVYGLGMIAQRSMSILLLPLYTRYLSRADYGVLDLLDMVTSIAAMLLAVRLGPALFYYYFHTEGEAERGKYITTSLFGALVLGVSMAAVGVSLATPISMLVFQSPRYANLVQIAFLGFAGEPAVTVGFCYLRVRNQASTFVGLTLFRLAINVALNIVLLVAFGMGPAALLWSQVVSMAGLIIYFIVAILAAHRPSFDTAVMRQLALYSLPLGISAAGEFFLHFGDRMFLREAVSLSGLGLYALAYKLGMVVPFITSPFFTYWNSQMVGIVRQPHGPYTYARVATYLLLGLTTGVLLLTVYIGPITAVVAGPNFHGAAAFVPWLALAYLIRGMGSYWSNTFLLEKRPALVARTTWMGGAACLLAYALLIPPFGLWGAVAATLLGFSAMAAYAFWKSQRVRHFRYEYGRWAKIVVSAAASALPSVLLHPDGFWAQIALGSACMCLFATLLWSVRFATEGERRAADAALRRLFSRPSIVPAPPKD